MTPCFVDTYFFLALLRGDSAAGQDRAIEENRVNRKLCTTWFVLLELADHLCDQQNRRLFSMILRAIEADKNWSLTDCTSFVVMTDRAMTDALTGDRHFVQAGFRALLAPSF